MIVTIPPRGLASSPQGVISGVASVNNLSGNLTFSEGAGISIVQTGPGTLLVSTTLGAYLLQKGGDTVVGNLLFTPPSGGFGLGLAVLASDPAQLTAGGVYYNSASRSVRVSDGTAWGGIVPAANAVVSITAGSGLSGGTLNAATPTGTFSIDFTATAVWTGPHSFNQPITFSSAQTFRATELRVTGQSAQDLLVAQDAASWGRLAIGTEGQVLSVVSGKAAWQGIPATSSVPASVPQWRKVSFAYVSFAGAGQIAQQVCLSLPAGGFVHAVKIKHSAPFSGGPITGATLSVGTSAKPTKYSDAFGVFQAAGDAVTGNYATEGGENHAAPTPLYATLTVIGGMLSSLTSGAVDVWVMVSQAV